MKRFRKILIANRGEIAVRIIRAAKALGIPAVAVFSEPDRSALHVRLADEKIAIGSEQLADSYLHIHRIIDAAKKMRCDAIHPGYGFLAENPKLVSACEESGITFIGHLEKAGVEKVNTLVQWNDWRLIRFFSASGFEPARTVALELSIV